MPKHELDLLLVGGPMDFRGSWLETLTLARRLPALGVACRIAASRVGRLKMPRDPGLELVELSHVGWSRYLPGARRRLMELLRQRPPGLIHGQSAAAAGVSAWLSARLECPYVLSLHRADQALRVATRLRGCRAVITHDRAVRDALLARARFPKSLVHVVQPGIAVDELAGAPVLAGRTPVIGVAGPVDESMDHVTFVAAAKHVLATGRDVQFLIAGTGAREAGLRRLVRELGIEDRVTFSDAPADLVESLGAMDVVCLPTEDAESLPLALAAMALGRALVVSGQALDVVCHDQTGMRVPWQDSQALAGAMRELLDDPTRARALGTQARWRAARDFPLEPLLLQTTAVYQGALQEPPPATIRLGSAGTRTSGV